MLFISYLRTNFMLEVRVSWTFLTRYNKGTKETISTLLHASSTLSCAEAQVVVFITS